MVIRHLRCANSQTYEYWLEQEVGTTGRAWRSDPVWLTIRPGAHPESLYAMALNIIIGRLDP